MSEEVHPRDLLLWSVQRALLGAVPPSLRTVTCDLVGTEIEMRFVFDGPIDPDDEESARMAATEVIAAFRSPPWTINDQIIRLDYPADLQDYPPELRVYERKERTSEGKLLR